MFHEFCNNLFCQGRAVVSSTTWQATPEELARTTTSLHELEAAYRLTLPGTAPRIQPASLMWGAQTLAWAAGLLLDRDQAETVIPAAIRQLMPDPSEPTVVYSVDLMMRFLPSLVRKAVAVDRDDPLLVGLTKLAHDWPLSSIGMSLEAEFLMDLSPIAADGCLRQLYIDRVISTQDRSRLSQPWVYQGVVTAAGDYPQLVGDLLRDAPDANRDAATA